MSRTCCKNFIRISTKMAVLQYIEVCTVREGCCEDAAAIVLTDQGIYHAKANTFFSQILFCSYTTSKHTE